MMIIIFVGRSNVGKSSTIRAITGAKIRIGKRPGVTLKPDIIYYEGHRLIDLPGFGFMERVNEEKQEKIRDFIVHFVERGKFDKAVQVTDIKSFAEIAKRWEKRGYIPLEIEMFHFLRELGYDVVLVANKIDKIPRDKRDEKLNELCELLGLHLPWYTHKFIVPFSAKTKENLNTLKEIIFSS